MSTDNSLSRRTLARGAAWTVPAVAIAAAAPVMAASGGPPTITQTGNACKNSGNSCKSRPKGYTVPLRLCNQSPYPVYIYSVVYGAPSDGGAGFTYAPPPTLPIQIPANDCVDIYCNASSTTSSNRVFTMSATFTWGHTPVMGDDIDQDDHYPVVITISVTGTPPDCTCPD